MQYRGANYSANTWDTYWYEKNLFGDIVAVYGNDGTKLISYTYDAWGNFTTSYHNSGVFTTAIKNPFTYRGYYYDSDLGLYYLQTRYYDSNTGRFINADGYVTTGQGLISYNMYAYCGNNPIMHVDYSGEVFTLAALGTGLLYSLLTASAITVGTALVYDATHEQELFKATREMANNIIDVVAITLRIATPFTLSKAEEKEEVVIIPKEPNSSVIFPVDPNTFNPIGLVKKHRDGTKNGAFISWMDPFTNIEVFRWDENLNYSNGPHYHIHGTGHYYPEMTVPEPYATIYFPVR